MKRILALTGVAALCAMACSSTPQADSPQNGVTPTGIQPAERSQTTAVTTTTPPAPMGADASEPGSGWSSSSTSTTAPPSTASGAQPSESGPTKAQDSAAPKTMTGSTTDNVPSRPDADNTRVNARDRNSSNLTPMDQGGSEADRKTTQQVRKAVMGDSSLSFTAKNVKIITVNGRVTLRGAVKTDQERASIEAAAKKIAGDAQVDNQIEVKK